MKRDMNLLREILLRLEKKEDKSPLPSNFKDSSYEKVAYHIQLLYQADLIEAEDMRDMGSTGFLALDLTWKGQEFLGIARSEPHWQKAMAQLGENPSFLGLERILTRLHFQSLAETE